MDVCNCYILKYTYSFTQVHAAEVRIITRTYSIIVIHWDFKFKSATCLSACLPPTRPLRIYGQFILQQILPTCFNSICCSNNVHPLYYVWCSMLTYLNMGQRIFLYLKSLKYSLYHGSNNTDMMRNGV